MILELYEGKRRKVTGISNILSLNFTPENFQRFPGCFPAKGGRLRSNP